MVAGCISEMESSSVRNLMIPLANVDQPGLVCVVRPLEELTRAIQKGERIWQDTENQLCRIQVLLGWLQAYQSQTTLTREHQSEWDH